MRQRYALLIGPAFLVGCPQPACERDLDCDDANPCTLDQCNAGECQRSPDSGATPTQNASDDCLRELCQGEALVSLPDDAETPPQEGAACVIERCQTGEVVRDFAPPGAGGCNIGEFCDADTGCIQNVRDIFASPPNATLFGSVDFAQSTNFTGLGVGDFNDDGAIDIAASEPDVSINVNGGFRDSAGQVKVSFGPFAGEVDAASSVSVFGAAEGDRAGLAVASCDFDGDGDDDLFVGAPNAEPGGFASGQIIGVPGPISADIDLNQIVLGVTAGLQIGGDQPTSFAPDRLLCADLNGDSADDLLIGAANIDASGRVDAGAVFVFLGGALSGSRAFIDADITVIGHSDAMHLGGALEIGDLDGDSRLDLIMGAPSIGANQLRPESVVVLSNTLLFTAGVPTSNEIDLSVEANAAYIDGGARGLFGFALSAADVNGDGVDDLAIGAILSSPQGRNQAGEVDIVYGASPFVDRQIDASTTQIFGFDPQDETGISLASGDFNGDGREDLLVGAHRADGLDNNRPESGEVFLFFGGAPLAAGQVLDLTSAAPGLTIFGGQAGDSFGKHVQMFDLDANGKQDLLISAQQDDTPTGRIDAGSLSIVLASPN